MFVYVFAFDCCKVAFHIARVHLACVFSFVFVIFVCVGTLVSRRIMNVFAFVYYKVAFQNTHVCCVRFLCVFVCACMLVSRVIL